MKLLWTSWLAVTVVATSVGCSLLPQSGGSDGTVFASITLRFLS